MRYFIRFSYKGTDFHGSQIQHNGITVQEVLQQAMTTLLREPISVVFAGRTDAGVHAQMMWAHWDWAGEIPMPLPTLMQRLNNLLPSAIAIQEIRPVTPEAHARYTALSRTYEYRVTEVKNPFVDQLCVRVPENMDYALMNEAAAMLIGRHDFASFCKTHTDVKTTFCTIERAFWTVYPDKTAIFTIEANRFLRNMVRAVVGTLWMVGRHQLTLEQFADIIAARNRCQAGQSAPPEGLYLIQVTYPETIFIGS